MVKKVLYKDNQYISYVEYGNPGGFPLIVQHGMVASIKNGDLFGSYLGKHARIICVARPGYGESSPVLMKSYREWGRIVSCLTNKLSITTFDVFSASVGAPYGYAVACACPAQVKNLYVYSGMPAFYDQEVRRYWPYPIEKELSQKDWEKAVYELFFANAPEEMLKNTDAEDSMRNNCFGLAQEFRLRFEDWGFDLSEVKAKVYMQHSVEDEQIPYQAAERTASLLPDCAFELLKEGPHFSARFYQQFIENTILPNILQ